MGIPGAANPLLLVTAAASGYSISRSIRLNSADSAYLSRTPASAGNRKTWTWAGWVKRSALGAAQELFAGGTGGTDATQFEIGFASSDILFCWGASTEFLNTTQVFRDIGAWYHIVVALDTTQATANNRLKLYVNGSEVTTFSTNNRASLTQNGDFGVNQAALHTIGRRASAASWYLNGYLADLHFIDGQALTPSSFGEFDTNGIWQPKAYSGSYGTNGFRLPFSDNSAATATTLGKDSAGSNNWTPNNFQSYLLTGAYTSNTTVSTAKPVQIANMFDGSDSTFQEIGGFTQNVYYTATVNASLLGTGALVIHTSYGVSSGDINVFEYNITHNGGATTGWTSYTVTQGSAVAVNIGTYTNITQINIRCRSTTSSGNGGQYVFGFSFNGNRLIDNAFAGRNDSLVDSPTNGTASSGGDAGGVVVGNYATWNPLTGNTYSASYKNGNLDFDTNGIAADGLHVFGTFQLPSSGKWYWETVFSLSIGFVGINSNAGIGNNTQLSTMKAYNPNGDIGGSGAGSNSTFTTGDIIGAAYDADAGTLKFYKNGSLQGTTISSVGFSTGPWWPQVRQDRNATSIVNFGQRPFAYAAPSGFKSLNTANLPTPTILKGSDYFDVTLYTGNSTDNRAITGLGFSPDLVWFGPRSQSGQDKVLCDIVRGTQKALFSNQTYVEANPALYGSVGSFDSTGFTIKKGTDATFGYHQVNLSGSTYAAWCWDAGSSTVTNTAGSISAQVRASASSGFSVVTWTGNGATNATVGHGLGVTPAMIIVKNRDTTNSWAVWFTGFSANEYLVLNSTGAKATFSTQWGSTPTSTVFGVADTSVNGNGNGIVAYCFAPVNSYSFFGSYTGNGSTDGPFVFCNFRPRWLLIKSSSAAGESWFLLDSARSLYNVTQDYLVPNSSASEASAYNIVDLLSNGFKLRTSGGGSAFNGSGATYIYAAFAENPFQISRAR